MANAQFIFVQFPRQTKVREEKIRGVLDKALDWIEVSPNSWLLWTSSSPEKWYARLQSAFDTETNMFICVINPELRHGRMPRSFWQFLNKAR